ncbi:spermatogenesis-associated protein 33 isoform X2 [Alligator sinensis]|uniref:Spermatogenesis-associated protein 33 isoform X2 n=1 Tax=Alligator sinensis TaxID=38654 RepID=A0A1U7S248_ALLSI|nr:spermatogenesis-associated protein 33 isoform X2 [Alligator sinensis]
MRTRRTEADGSRSQALGEANWQEHSQHMQSPSKAHGYLVQAAASTSAKQQWQETWGCAETPQGEADAQQPTVSQTWEQRKADLQKHSQHIQTSPQAHTNHVQAPSGKSAKKQQQKSSGAADRPRKKVEKLAKKKRYIIPKIIVTGPLDEEESYTDVDDLPESKTIRDTEYYGPYNVHTKPSTIEAYQVKREMP